MTTSSVHEKFNLLPDVNWLNHALEDSSLDDLATFSVIPRPSNPMFISMLWDFCVCPGKIEICMWDEIFPRVLL